MAAAQEARPAPATARAAPPPPQPKKRMAPTAQQQLELRQKALEEQRKKSATAAAASSTGSSNGSHVTAAALAAAETIDKGNKRVAHHVGAAANMAVGAAGLAVPRVSVIPGKNNLQLAFRQQVVEKFVQIMSQIYKNQAEVYEKALQTEADIAKVSFHMGTYRWDTLHSIDWLVWLWLVTYWLG